MQEQKVTIVSGTSFAIRLGSLMKSHSATNAALARAIGVSHVAIGNYLKGRIPTAVILQKIADFFSVSIDKLLPNIIQPDKPNQSVSLYEWMAEPTEKKWESLSESQKNRRALRWFAVSAEQSRIEVSKQDEQRGRLEVRIEYRGGKRPSDFPQTIRLIRPPAMECKRLLAEIITVIDCSSVLFACLPELYRNWGFIDKLDLFCFMAIERASMHLCFGHKWLELLSEHVKDSPLPESYRAASKLTERIKKKD